MNIDITKLVPMSNKVICKPVPLEDQKTDAGLILTSTEEEDVQIAIVVAVGKGEYNLQGVFNPTTVKVGDRVLHNRFGTSFQRIGKETYLIIRENEFIGVLTD